MSLIKHNNDLKMTEPHLSMSDCIASNNKGVISLLNGDYIEAMQTFKMVLKGYLRNAISTTSNNRCFDDQQEKCTIFDNPDLLVKFKALPNPSSLLSLSSSSPQQSSTVFLHAHAAMLTSQYQNFQAQDVLKISCAVVLYNVTITYQMMGFQQQNEDAISCTFDTVLGMYKNALLLLQNATSSSTSTTGRTDLSLVRLNMAITNNMGYIFYTQSDRNGVRQSMKQLQTVFKKVIELRRARRVMFGQEGQDPTFQFEFELNVLAFEGALCTAGAA